MSTFRPTDEQQDAIDYNESMVITACPGSGKTTVMKEKIRQITNSLPNHKGVIAITFTQKASQELKTRCQYNSHDTKQSFFGTIDSFCLTEIILPFISRIWGSSATDISIVKKIPHEYLSFFSRIYNIPTIDDIIQDDGFRNLFESGILWMKSFASLSTYILRESQSACRYIKSKYSHIFVDEYQDSSEPQHQLFLEIKNLGLITTVVGDIWQSIYEFRGGNSRLLEELIRDSDNFRHFEITINHRCHPSIINYASRLLNYNHTLTEYDPNNIKVYRKNISGNVYNAAAVISSWVTHLLANGHATHSSDIAILSRKKESIKLLASNLSIPYRIHIDNKLDKISSKCSDLYIDLLYYRFNSTTTIQDIIDKHFDRNNLTIIKLSTLRNKIKSLRKENISIEETIDNFRELATILHILNTEVEDNALQEIIEDQNSINQFKPLNQNEIQLMTLHKSKGLEFNIVFHIDMEEWTFPYRTMGETWDDIIYPTLSQDINLHYVGITRAKNLCFLIKLEYRQNSKGEFKRSSPSYFLTLPQLEGLYNT